MLGRPGVEDGWRSPAGPSPATAAPVLRLTRASRVHGGSPVWAPLDLALAAGTLTVVTGPNGAGKSTLLRLAAGLTRPSTGGRECAGRALYVRGGGGLRSAQTVLGAVSVTAGLAGRREAATAAVQLLGLQALAHRRVGTLSAGERVRAALAAAVACRPALLCLDEPTAALDSHGMQALVTVLDTIRADGGTVLVATHQPDALLAAADGHLVVGDGRVVLR
ncbi:ABC transporter ATP-binding protein [Blastococcus saxobsidens]|uniref:Putative ABC-type multidrug transport system, ATPase component n=1 Tax=Blastococcus saxobsidens (strain DD2) TaxID=1146883 RepID=H6RP99_BLASD|nr:ATP-binding cassette domain-containing protein [Blastococcus saxobsidens]CCG03958.1 putative ABC-type multidrug transport system, ATPase component [Blastococcus saxobsidens DD2]